MTAGTGGEGDRGIGRRALLIGGAATAVGAGLLAKDELGRAWWRMPGVDKPRTPGAVDFPGARWLAASPSGLRRADRPADYPIDRIVVHVTQGSYGSTVRAFRDPDHGAATHYVVDGGGGVTQFVRELDVAFHAANREWNERSVGIEHVGWVDRPESFTAAMYRSSARLTRHICERYDIPLDREHLVGHVEVPGADHTDPGPHWDWDRYLHLVREARPTARS